MFPKYTFPGYSRIGFCQDSQNIDTSGPRDHQLSRTSGPRDHQISSTSGPQDHQIANTPAPDLELYGSCFAYPSSPASLPCSSVLVASLIGSLVQPAAGGQQGYVTVSSLKSSPDHQSPYSPLSLLSSPASPDQASSKNILSYVQYFRIKLSSCCYLRAMCSCATFPRLQMSSMVMRMVVG